MSYLTKKDRIKIEYFLNENYLFRKIAKILNENVSTISREVKRNICIFKASKNCKRFIGSSKANITM